MGSRASDATVTLTSGVLAAISAHARDDAPREACGILGADPAGVVVRAEPVANVAAGERAFRLDPAGELAAFDEIDAAGLEFAGIYHSHPAGSGARPSPADVEGAEMAGARAGVIVVPREDGGADVTAFAVAGGAARELSVVVAR
jgi:proteasome lid subunit RPN8/RPN11